jgi:hypothetical protein
MLKIKNIIFSKYKKSTIMLITLQLFHKSFVGRYIVSKSIFNGRDISLYNGNIASTKRG